jgi:DNA topoisomerase-1
MAPKAQAKDSKSQADAAASSKKESKGKSQAKVESESDEEEEEEEQWWEMENATFAQKGEKRWTTLKHNGVLFPPLYVPHGIPIRYNGEDFKMTPEEEEVATMFAVMKETDYYRNEIFRRNFFSCWKEILDKRSNPIKNLNLCDFEAIWLWHQRNREAKLNRTKEEKKKEKLEAEALALPFKFCTWDGKKEQVANYRVEPPGLFRGRGKHPLQGMLKLRVQPEDITINISEGEAPPTPPAGHKWAEVRHDNTVTWLAMWRDNVCGNHKYVMLAANSAVKGMSDMMKFEKARKLKDHIEAIRESYQKDFHSTDLFTRQRAVAMYFIDKLALRVGNEKDELEADTVGCCSLRVEHVTPQEGNILHFDFLGKDSIRYVNDVEVLPIVHQLVTSFRARKHDEDDIFNLLSPTQLNVHLKSIMPGLTAKVFRTFNASYTLQQHFDENKLDKKMSEADKLAYFNSANTRVAILCNHQKAVSKGHTKLMMQLESKVKITRDYLARLEKAAKTKNEEKAMKEFYEEEDKIQREWLNAYGTPEQIKEYDELVKNRGTKRPRATKKEESDDEDETIATVVSKGKKGSTAPPPSKKAKVEETKPSKKTTPKVEEKKKPAAGKKKAKAEDSDDDTPLSAL